MRRKLRKSKKDIQEHEVQNEIMAVLRLHGCVVFRVNVMAMKVKDSHGKWRMVRSLPKSEDGFPDLFGFKKSNHKIFFIECKRPVGGVISPKQRKFHYGLMHDGAIHGVAKSPEDALKIVDEELVGYGYGDKNKLWL